ncbi:uncharacterized protein LOC110449246 isoform X2 [Mizuhopecten yessoensis]|uniref:uncharacterized protein LOC110449246 isoform X2 n=1 Tax=Mizuhopecten yessoensis TaxID=6573 RepID=UPI000B45993E|nr:uncharacterized protein LOC110449246 isoform X2 [Mizuhopecten yessoensis]
MHVHFSGLGIFLMLLSLVSATKVKEQAWREPCGGPPAAPPPGLPVPPPITTVNTMIPILEDSVFKANELKNKYLNERFSSKDRFIAMMNDFHFEGMPAVSMSLSEISQSLSNLTLAHQTNYEKVSRALVFLEQVALDEDLLESSSYIDDVSSIQIGALNLLCNKQKLILNAGAVINYVSSSIMKDDVRGYSNIFERHVRDYIIVKDVYRLLETMLTHVQAIHNSLAA